MEINQNKIRILVIDDDEGDQFLIEDYLREITEENFEISFASNYHSAREIIHQKKHDIYLVDYYLGEKTGLELIAEAVEEGYKKPFVLLTGLHSREVDERAISAGAYDYLPKDNLSAILLERTIRHSIERYKQFMLAQSRGKRFSTLFHHSVDPIYITDKNFKIQEVNNSFLELFGSASDSVLGKSLAIFFVNEEEFQELKERLTNEESIKDGIFDLRHQDKITALFSIASIVNEETDELEGFQGVIHDMTELKNAEKQVLVAEKISLTGRMARMVGHEVRNPLTNINLAIDELKEEMPNDNDEARLFLDMIERNSERISSMIDQLLQGTRVKELDKKDIDLVEVVQKSLSFCEDRFNLKEISFQFVHESKEAIISADPEQLEIVFINLFTNAVEAMESSEQKELKVELDLENRFYSVKITDSGKGMNENTRAHLFEPFYSERSKGMGLGMATVHNLVILHKGKISVSSEEGKGAQFHLKFPRQ